MSTSADYFATARKLLDGSPTDTDIRRAVSTTYYALFHHICGQFSDIVLRPSTATYNRAWQQVYRYPDHGPVKQRCLEAQDPQRGFPRPVAKFAREFAQLQQRRVDADYNPHSGISLTEAEVWIATAEQAIADFATASPEDQRAFVLFICLKPKTR